MSTGAWSMSSSRALTSRFTSCRIGGSGSLRPWEGDAAVLHLRTGAQPEGYTHAEGPTCLNLLYDSSTAAEQRKGFARLPCRAIASHRRLKGSRYSGSM
jgi:hypothetical protein